MSKKLGINIEVTGTIVTVDVYRQDPSITAKCRESRLEYKASNGISIRSLVRVGAYASALYIRGYKSVIPSEQCSSIKFNSNDEAQSYKEELLFALKEWADNDYFPKEDAYLKQNSFEF